MVRWSSEIPRELGLYWIRLYGGDPEPCRVGQRSDGSSIYMLLGDEDDELDKHSAAVTSALFGPPIMPPDLAEEAAQVCHEQDDGRSTGYDELSRKLASAGFPRDYT